MDRIIENIKQIIEYQSDGNSNDPSKYDIFSDLSTKADMEDIVWSLC